MDVNAVAAAGSAPSPHQPLGVSAQLADARSQLRAAVPAASWDAVLAEVQRLHIEQSMPMLAALQTVYAKIASGWLPRPPAHGA